MSTSTTNQDATQHSDPSAAAAQAHVELSNGPVEAAGKELEGRMARNGGDGGAADVGAQDKQIALSYSWYLNVCDTHSLPSHTPSFLHLILCFSRPGLSLYY